MAILAVAASGSAAWAGKWHLQPHLEVLETYTDNVDLRPTNKQDDFVTRLSPGLHLMGEGAKVKADINYTLNYLYFAKSSDKSEWRHNLEGRVNSELVDETFFLDAGASINQQFVEQGAAFSSNYDNKSQNRKTVQNYMISPELKHAFGTWGTVEARYSLNYVRTNADKNLVVPGGVVIQNTTTHDWSLGILSGRQFPRLVWGLDAEYQLQERKGNSGNSKRKTVRGNVSYPVSLWLSLVGSAGYEKIEDNTLSRRPNGFIWDAGVMLKPGPRTSLSVRGGRRYNDTNISVDGQYLFSTRTRLTVGYHDTITTSQNILAQQLAGNVSNAGGGAGAGGTIGNGFGNQGSFSLLNNSFHRKRAEGALSGSRGRSSFNAGGYYETRDYDLTNLREKDWGGFAGFKRQIGPHLDGFISGDYHRAQFHTNIPRTDKVYVAQVGLDYKISQDISGGVEYLMNRRDSNNAAFNLRENAVRIHVLATF
jgi:uncharacterized protein (PEP-CTERM system associated)